jgi:hypothetical protein
MLDEMRGEAIRGIDMIKHHDVDIADRERAVNDHERIVEVSAVKLARVGRVGEQITPATCSSRSRLREVASFSGLSSVWHR